MKTKNKTKKQESVRYLKQRITELARQIQVCENTIAGRDVLISRQRDQIGELQGQLRELRETKHCLADINTERLKNIGHYFAAIDAEVTNSEASLEYLRKLRARIFE